MKWSTDDIQRWYDCQKIQRSYDNDVVKNIKTYDYLELINYGLLNSNYQLFALKTLEWTPDKPSILITGGVHGYETSGVHGALEFIEKYIKHYAQDFNIMVIPCVSPWGYETINRWNAKAIDPNRSFSSSGHAEESLLLKAYIDQQDIRFIMHLDLHETTDTDNSVFRPALASRDGIEDMDEWDIPDGFYLVGDIESPEENFHTAIIDEVRKVTHIAPADRENKIIGYPISQEGVFYIEASPLGLCMSLTKAQYRTTTEVYPDSKNASPESCIQAQVNAIVGGIEYIKNIHNK